MTVCTFWEEGDCWYGDRENCWYDHYNSSDEEGPPATAPTTLTASAFAFPKPTSATLASSSALDLAIAKLPKLPSISVKATTSPPLIGLLCAPQAMSVQPPRPKSPESAEDTSTRVVATDPTELSSQELNVNEDVESHADEATLLVKIANLKETVRMLEASADPERQSFKNDLLRDELNTASEKNRELQIDVKALNTQEAKFCVKICDLETKLDGFEKVNAALSKDLDQERKDSRANRTNSEVYLKALQEINAISTKATTTEAQDLNAFEERSEARSLTVCREDSNLSLTSPQLVSSGSSSCTSTLQPADSTYSKTSSSPVKPPFTPAFGSTPCLGAKSLFFGPKKPSFSFGGLALPRNKSTSKNGPEQPHSGLPPFKPAPSSITRCEAKLELKRKIEETEGREGDQIQRDADATTSGNDGQCKRARIDTDEEWSESESG